ncbi:MAG: SgcJ/EcaC family oxidoreductase [Anaerolineae bacterium]
MTEKERAPGWVHREVSAFELAEILSAAMDEAWNARDAAAMAALFEPEADFTFHNGLHVHGRDAIERFWSDRVFPRTSPSARHLGKVTGARFVTEHVAVGTADFMIYDATMANAAVAGRAGGIPEGAVHLRTRALGVAVRREGVWRYTVVQLWVPQGRSA